MLCWDNVDAGTALIDRYPETRFIVDHLAILQPRVSISLRSAVQSVYSRLLAGEVGVNRGDDALPYSRAELRAKFLDLTGRVWAADHAGLVLDATLALSDGNATLSDWTRLLRVDHPRGATFVGIGTTYPH